MALATARAAACAMMAMGAVAPPPDLPYTGEEVRSSHPHPAAACWAVPCTAHRVRRTMDPSQLPLTAQVVRCQVTP